MSDLLAEINRIAERIELTNLAERGAFGERDVAVVTRLLEVRAQITAKVEHMSVPIPQGTSIRDMQLILSGFRQGRQMALDVITDPQWSELLLPRN